MLRYLQFAFNNWYQSAEQDIKSRQQTLWVFVEEGEGGREAGREGGHHSHNNTTNVTAKVNWNQRPPEHHEGWMVGSRF
jgi:hypothetical protein